MLEPGTKVNPDSIGWATRKWFKRDPEAPVTDDGACFIVSEDEAPDPAKSWFFCSDPSDDDDMTCELVPEWMSSARRPGQKHPWRVALALALSAALVPSLAITRARAQPSEWASTEPAVVGFEACLRTAALGSRAELRLLAPSSIALTLTLTLTGTRWWPRRMDVLYRQARGVTHCYYHYYHYYYCPRSAAGCAAGETHQQGQASGGARRLVQ